MATADDLVQVQPGQENPVEDNPVVSVSSQGADQAGGRCPRDCACACACSSTRKTWRQDAAWPEMNLDRILDEANAPVFQMDRQLHVTRWNQKLVALTGRPSDQVVGLPLASLLACSSCSRLSIDPLSQSPPKNHQQHYHFRRSKSLAEDHEEPIPNDDHIETPQQEFEHEASMEEDEDEEIDEANMRILQTIQDAMDAGQSCPQVNLSFQTFCKTQWVQIQFNFTCMVASGSDADHDDSDKDNNNHHQDNTSQVVVGAIGIGQDVTSWRMQEKQYSRVIMQANVPIIELDGQGQIKVWNAKAAQLTGFTLQQVFGRKLIDIVEYNARACVQEAIDHILQSGIAGPVFALKLLSALGTQVEILSCLTPNFDSFGRVIGVVAIGQDVTQTNAKEMEYRKLIDSANAPIFGVDTERKLVIFNKKAVEISEFAPEEVMGEDLVQKLISEEYQDAVASVFQEALEGIETANFEFPLVTKTGRKVVILLNATPRYDHLGKISGVVGIGQDITERIIQEQEYWRLIDTANAPIFGVDRDFRIVIWNKKAATITQYSNQDTTNQKLLQYISSEYQQAVEDVLSKALDGTETANFEFTLVTKSGRRLDILLNATPKFDHFGNICGVIGIGQDITERRAQEQEYTRLIDTANAPIFGVDKDGRVNIWNRKAAQITEYSVFDVLNVKLVESFIPEEYKSGVGRVLSKALEGIETANFEFPLITRTGRRVEILLNATPRYDEKGAIIGVVGIGQDITVRIAQEQEYSRLIDTANAPIFGVDASLCVNIWNKKAAEITQYSTEDVMGKDLVKQFISEEYRSGVRSVMTQALRGAQTANFNLPLITKAGRRVEILLNATPRYNELGHIVGVVGIGQDITERIAQEQEYARLIDTANAPIFGVDEEGCVNIWNKKAAEITQYTPSDVMGEHLVDKFITEDYREAVGYVLSKALDGSETANFEFPLITKTGRRVEILLNATPRFNEHGKVKGMVGIGQDITDRIAQEQEYSRLIEKANAPIFGIDQDGCITIWNRKTAEITQYPTEEVLGENLVDKFISADYRQAVANVLKRALEGYEAANFEFPLITKTGRRVEFLLNATPTFDQQGKITGVVGIGQDITDRIAQEQEYSRLIDTANAPIFGVDAKMCVNIWNKKAAQITHYSTSEVMGENLVETFISPEYRPIVAEVFSKALAGIQTANFEFPLITRPGTRIEILLNATPRMDCHGNIVGVVGIGQDITDRIAQEQEYFRLIDTANAPIFGVDTKSCINEWNQKIEEITGYHKSAVLGLSLVDAFIIPESRQQVAQLLNQALIGIDVGEMELPMTTKSGRFLLLLVNASSKKDMHGNIRGVIGVGQDYTAKKHMEAAKVNFLASFSHELRTPLNGVLGMLELLKEQKLDKLPQRYVHMAYISGSLLLNLINDILDLSKIEAGHLEISSDPFQMQDLLDYSIEIFKFKAREKGIKLSLECSPNVPPVLIGDVVRLRQVILNLLSNSIKFTNKGSITVKCRAVPSPNMPRCFIKLLFQVIDTGVGMDDEEKLRLFSLFTKLERTRKNNPTGSGLGLAICKQLVELMQGEIDVDSELGEGSEFFFTVVLRRVDDNQANALLEQQVFPAITQAEAAPGVTPVAALTTAADKVPKQARILVVEDNEFNWEVVKCFFTEDNHWLQWEANGKDAVAAYKEHYESYDLILMDCEMPIMDGYTATQNIRRFEKEVGIPRIPVLGLTAYAMSNDRQKCLDAGMDEFIVKPISKVSLRNAVRQWMRVRYLGQKQKSRESSQVSDEAGHDEAVVPVQDLGVHLVPASHHGDTLDLTRAISDLELEDPMMIGREANSTSTTADNSQLISLTSISESKSDVTGRSFVDQVEMEPSPVVTSSDSSLPVGADQPVNSASTSTGTQINNGSSDSNTSAQSEPSAGSSTIDFSNASFEVETKNDIMTTRAFRATSVGTNTTTLMTATAPGASCAKSTKSSGAGNSVLWPEDIPIPDGDPVNYTLGVSQCGGNETMFVELLEKFGSQLEVYMRNIDNHYEQSNYTLLRRESHSLKGSSAYVAASRMSKAAFRVQVACERVMDKDKAKDLEETALRSLRNSVILLQKEHRIMQGYLRRNFSFRRQSNRVGKGKKKKSEEPNACLVM